MARPFLSLVIASAATAAGLALAWWGASLHDAATSQGLLSTEGTVALLAGAALFAVAAATVALHWVGPLVVGGVHALLGMLALIVPLGNPFGGGIFSPVFQITRMLSKVDRVLGDGAMVYYFSGTALVVGAFLVGAALGIRSRRLSPPSNARTVAVTSLASAVLVLAAAALLLAGGGTFVRSIVQLFRYDAVAAGVAVGAGMLAGVAGLLLRWSSAGVIVAGLLVLVAGVAFAVAPYPADLPGRILAAHGLLALVGATTVGAALGGVGRSGPEVPADTDDL